MSDEILDYDLVLKGGVASAIIYPGLIWKLIQDPGKMKMLGGTSAGAIGAALAAAYCIGQKEYANKSLLKKDSGNLLEGLFGVPFNGSGSSPSTSELNALPAGNRMIITKAAEGLKGVRDEPQERFAQLCLHLALCDGLIPGLLAPSLQDGRWRKFVWSVANDFIRKKFNCAIFSLIVFFLLTFLTSLLLVNWRGYYVHPGLKHCGLGALVLTCAGAFVGATVLLAVLYVNQRGNRFLTRYLGITMGRPPFVSSLFQPVHQDTCIDEILGLCYRTGDGVGKKISSPIKSRTALRLTNWLHFWIQYLAFGTDLPDSIGPATTGVAGSEEKPCLQVVSTNLSTGEPETFPHQAKGAYFAEELELNTLFPSRVLELMLLESKLEESPGMGGLTKLTHRGEVMSAVSIRPVCQCSCPLLFLARISLSFPPLFKPIPLWLAGLEIDELDPKKTPKPRFLECIFSDGGITSNFPIHKFDDWVPKRPTLGVNLCSAGSRASIRHRRAFFSQASRKAALAGFQQVGAIEQLGKAFEERVFMPRGEQPFPGTTWEPIHSFEDFLGKLFSTSQNWRDNLQARLDGYRDRICEIWLTDDEGGLNLWMDFEARVSLLRYGFAAGEELVLFKNSRFLRHKEIREIQLDNLLRTKSAELADDKYSKLKAAIDDLVKDVRPHRSDGAVAADLRITSDF